MMFGDYEGFVRFPCDQVEGRFPKFEDLSENLRKLQNYTLKQ